MGAYSSATERAWASDSKVFSEWCRKHRRKALPASPETIAAFLKDQAKGKKAATLRRYLATLSHLHTAAELPDPTKVPAVQAVLKRAAKSQGTRQRQARGLSEEDVEKILAVLGDSLIDLRDRALLLVGRDMLARRSELVGLDVEDIQKGRDGSGTALIRRSKTDQNGLGAEVYLSPLAMRSLSAWLTASEIEQGPIFRKVDRWGNVSSRRLGSTEVSLILKKLAKKAGLRESTRISGHSLRVGMAQDLVASGVELPDLMQAGRWKSPEIPARYAERQLASRGAVARYHRKKSRKRT